MNRLTGYHLVLENLIQRMDSLAEQCDVLARSAKGNKHALLTRFHHDLVEASTMLKEQYTIHFCLCPSYDNNCEDITLDELIYSLKNAAVEFDYYAKIAPDKNLYLIYKSINHKLINHCYLLLISRQ